MVKQTHHQRGAGFSTTPEIRSVSQLKLRRFKTRGGRASGCSTEVAASPLITSGAVGAESISDNEHRLPSLCSGPRSTISSRLFLRTCYADVLRIRHFWIWIADAREITRARIHIQIFEQPIIAILLLHFRYAAFRIFDVAKDNRLGRASLRARAGEGFARDARVRGSAGAHMRRELRLLNALDAEGALLHHPAHPHRDVRIFLQLHDVGRAFGRERREIFFVDAELPGDFLFTDRSLVVIEIIEAAHFEWAVVRAIAGADAAVVSHDVEAVLAVNCRVDRTDRFARRVLAML